MLPVFIIVNQYKLRNALHIDNKLLKPNKVALFMSFVYWRGLKFVFSSTYSSSLSILATKRICSNVT